jgi:hypothetical protein
MNGDDMEIMNMAAREALPLPAGFDGRIRDVCRALPDRPETPGRRRLTPALAIAAAILLLTGTALAAGVLDLSSMPDMLRRMVGTENVQTAPDYISYEDVEYAPGAFNADVHHAGRGHGIRVRRAGGEDKGRLYCLRQRFRGHRRAGR